MNKRYMCVTKICYRMKIMTLYLVWLVLLPSLNYCIQLEIKTLKTV
jgi:hypothetical protein